MDKDRINRMRAEAMRRQEKQAAQVLGAGVEFQYPPDTDIPRTPEPVSEEEWAFRATLHDLVTRARWNLPTKRVSQILMEQAHEFEIDIQRAGSEG